ncbi:hypothetical protein KXR53_18360 [Inquilinus limosus]|uniref:hypothetical protein n=1 Tax=Inquilinus limosus TaxID=171674 RepID=UPI003F136FED
MGMMAVCRTDLATLVLTLGVSLQALCQIPAATAADSVMETIDQIRIGVPTQKRRYLLAKDLPTMVAEADRRVSGKSEQGLV